MAERRLVRGQRLAREGARLGAHLRGGTRAHDLSAALTALGSEIDDPVRRADHIEVVLDHQQGVPGDQQLAECLEELRHVLEMQSRRRLVEQEQLAAMRGAREHGGGIRQVPGELQALRFAAGERRHRLPELEVFEPDITQWREPRGHLGRIGEERTRFGHGEVEHLGDAQAPAVRALAADVEHFLPVAAAVAVRTAQVHVREELHLHVLETVAAAGGAAAVAGVEAEGAAGVLALLRGGLGGEQRADGIEGADVARGIRARRAADRVLIDHDDIIDQLSARETRKPAGSFRRPAAVLEECRVQHVLDQGGLARARDSRDAYQALERNAHIEVLQVVLGRSPQLQPAVGAGFCHDAVAGGVQRRRRAGGSGFAARRDLLAPAEVLPGERRAAADLRRAAEEDHLAAALPGPGTQIEDAISLQHDLRVVLDHDERVARIAQALHHPDDPLHVARMQPDGGLIENEQCVDERGAERGREVDALYLAPRERA